MVCAVCVSVLSACGGKGPKCGPNTTLVGDQCNASVVCGPGTKVAGARCVPDCGGGKAPSATCADIKASIVANNKAVQAANADDFDAATPLFEEATRLYASNHEAWYGLGHMQGRDKRWEESARSFAEAVRYAPDNAMYQMWLGIALYESGELNEAAAHLAETIALEPNMYRAHWYMGRVHRDVDRPQKAAESWTTACALNPSYGPPFVRLGELYLNFGRADEAIAVLEQGAKTVEKAIDLTNLYFYLGNAYAEKRRWGDAVEAYSKAIDVDPQNLDARFARGVAYANKGDKARARADLEAYLAVGQNPFNQTEANRLLVTLGGK